MKLRFRSESERNEFLVVNDLRVVDGAIVSLGGLRVGKVINTRVIELTNPKALEQSSRRKWWTVETSYGPVGHDGKQPGESFIEADTMETEVRRRLTQLRRPRRVA